MEVFPRIAAIDQDVDEVRFEGESFGIAFQRLARSPQLRQHEAEIVVVGGIVGCGFDRAPADGDRVVGLTFGKSHEAEQLQRHHAMRLFGEDGATIPGGVGEPPLLIKLRCQGQIVGEACDMPFPIPALVAIRGHERTAP